MPPILIISLGFIAGVLFSPFFAACYNGFIFAVIIVFTVLVVWVFRCEQVVVLWGIALISFLLGVIRYCQSLPGTDSGWISFYNGRKVVLEGTVSEPPEERGKTVKAILSSLGVGILPLTGDKAVCQTKGKVLAALRGKELSLNYGDRLRLQGALREPPILEEFSYKEYLETRGVYSLMEFPAEVEIISHDRGNPILALLYSLRNEFQKRLELFFPEPHASLLAGIVLGIKRNFSSSFYEAMRATGVLHIIVASGFNISLLIDKVAPIVAGKGRLKQTVVLAILVFAYTIIAGFQPPIVRAAITGAIAYLALVTGRRKHGLLMMILSASIMLFFNPFLYRNLSFQLSFGATSALILVFPYLQGKFPFLPGEVGDALGTTLAVQLMLTPWIVYKFSSVSLVAPVVNMAVLPVIGQLMLYGLIWLGFSFLGPRTLVTFSAWFLWAVVEYFVRVVELFGGLSWAGLAGLKISIWVVMAYYLVLTWCLWKLRRKAVASSKDN
ncbi:hypothetical protein B5M47_00325 [candidate division CPR3 bacterium 4484_211]|uniref:ComEC/Rec2-related protein domain-containing protein n=1 Tax=candidate division CPR3 bacterium 4484_211 TaxID=1968527 RepID=A0A1W9NZV6_UNCC3|nr:MAG: hypothetical protein B5M47_00325 [candidate division CPR3 bacterium 4484_211]